MNDEELRELGLPNLEIFQLRTIVNKLQATNGITNLLEMPPNNNNNKKKLEPCVEQEVSFCRMEIDEIEFRLCLNFLLSFIADFINYLIVKCSKDLFCINP